ncbi:ABC transporter permease [Candidatus Pacearchaeota archaeon]|nr:ABC transporter permease [Candidatus Pacearchaeota archaeon]
MFTDYFFLALRNVRKRGIRSWLTMLGIFIGIAAVVSLISLGQGLETAITGQFGALSVDTLTIQGADTGFSPPGSTSVRKMTEHDLEIIESVSGIKIAVPRYLRFSEIEFNDVLGFGAVGSIPDGKEEIEELYEAGNFRIAQGRLLEEGESGVVALGDSFVSNNLFGKPIRVGSQINIEGENFEVVGILERSSTFFLNDAVLMTEEDVKELFDIDDEIDFIVVRVEDKDEIETIAEEISRKLRKDRGQKLGEEDFEVQTPAQSLEAVNTIINVINVVVTGIALIALLVGGIGIANTMFTSVLERTREIGVMKAIGAENKNILSIFLVESAILGLIGGIVGACIGLALALGVSQIANTALNNNIFAVTPSAPLLIGSVSFSLLIGILSGLVPALQASKLNPVEALRK